MMKSVLVAIALAFTLGAPALAQAYDEIVVTGSRAQSKHSVSFGNTVPAIKLRRNADFLFTEAYIESDSRSADLRQKEVRATLKSLIERAGKDPLIELSAMKTFETEDDEINYLVDFSEASAEFSSGYRPDTTRIVFIVKTPIAQTDTDPEAISGRLEAFLEAVPENGRSTVSSDGDYGLTVVNLEQYRSELINLVAEDAREINGAFAGSSSYTVTGFEEPVRWQSSGPLSIDIYFPYSLTVSKD